nr:MAG: ORF1 [TTV-like mini virus]
MPFYRWRRPWRRWYHRRRFRRRYSRRPFRRRFWRRQWVRKKRKLPKIKISEWQPTKIVKSKVKGIYPCFIANHKRLSNNFVQWIDSTTAHLMPGGGGFGIIQFTLNGLYELFCKAQNWWTKSNCGLPLVRFQGTTLKFWAAENYDYVVQIQRCYPMCCTDLMYMSCQPFIMMMTKNTIFVPCTKKRPRAKPYKKIFVRPPAQMKTEWYFQSQLAKTGLIIIRTAACSLDRIYTGSTASSTTIGLVSLHTTTFQYHNWKNYPPTTGYKPQEKIWFYGTLNGESDPENEKQKNLIYLGGTGPLTQGEPISNESNLATYFNNNKKWGNIFDPHYLYGSSQVFITNKTNNEIKQELLKNNNLDKTVKNQEPRLFTPRTLPLLVECRYNPLADKGKGNKIYLISITSDVETWHEPKNQKLMRKDAPLWILTWGWFDWQTKLAEVHRIETEYLTVIESPYITPFLKYYVFLDNNFYTWPPLSPYGTELNAADRQNFFPKNNFQVQSINEIASCGPGVIKLNKDQSAEAHFNYKLHFKFGGCPAPMETICNPIEEAVYPIPNSKYQTTSLQSPTTPLSTYLYDFDERRQQITQRAAKRIKKDSETEHDIFQITGTTTMDLPASHQKTSQETTSESEESEEEIQQQLLNLRRKQLKLKRRILTLLQLQDIE